jgi:hypothetical protein
MHSIFSDSVEEVCPRDDQLMDRTEVQMQKAHRFGALELLFVSRIIPMT